MTTRFTFALWLALAWVLAPQQLRAGDGGAPGFRLGWAQEEPLTSISVGDFDGDGRDDFIINHIDEPCFRVFYSTGTGFSEDYQLPWYPTLSRPKRVLSS